MSKEQSQPTSRPIVFPVEKPVDVRSGAVKGNTLPTFQNPPPPPPKKDK